MLFVFIILSIILLDLSTKFFISKRMPIGAKFHLPKKGLFFWHIKNKGVAYNSFSEHPKKIIFISSIFIGALILKLTKCKKTPFSENISLSFLLGGAIGNFIERLKTGHVTDFLYFDIKKAPIFNIADVFINLGGILLILSSCFKK